MKAQRLRLDRLSSLPQSIIEIILCFVPIEEAVRTSILSRKWRYNWITIPKLTFNEERFKVSTDEGQLSVLEQTFEVPSQRRKMTRRCKFFYAIYQVLLRHQGPIHDFFLSMDADGNCVELDHIILHLARYNTVKTLTLCLKNLSEYWLPLSIYSLNQLTYLHLHQCSLDYQPTFNGFGNLIRLDLHNVNTTKKTLLHLVSNCPVLKTFCMLIEDKDFLDSDDSTVIDLFDSLPVVVEHISISHWVVECFAENGVPRVLPTKLAHLKSVNFEYLCYSDGYGLPFVGLVMRSSPNLEKLKLATHHLCHEKYEKDSVTLEDYSDIWLEHLNELVIEDFYNSKHELEFVKMFLARSPVLKTLTISLDDCVSKDEEIMLLKNLLRSPRASLHVEIFVERSYEF